MGQIRGQKRKYATSFESESITPFLFVFEIRLDGFDIRSKIPHNILPGLQRQNAITTNLVKNL